VSGDVPSAGAPPAEALPPDALSARLIDALWKRALEGWGDDAVHATLLDHALRSEELPEIAGRYRALLDDPVKGPKARKQLDAIVIAATNMLLSMKTPAPGKVPLPITLSAAGVSLLLLLWLWWAMFPHR
jgi:hypothetical protein